MKWIIAPFDLVHRNLISHSISPLHGPKVSPKCIFLFRKNRAVSHISVWDCRDPKFCYQFDTIFTWKWPNLCPKHAFLGVFRNFEQNLYLSLIFVYKCMQHYTKLFRCTYTRSKLFALKYRAVSYISAGTTNTVYIIWKMYVLEPSINHPKSSNQTINLSIN